MKNYVIDLIKAEGILIPSDYYNRDGYQNIQAEYFDIKTIGTDEWILFYAVSDSIEPEIVFAIKSIYVLCIYVDDDKKEDKNGE